MFAIRELRIFARVAAAQLRNGTESLAHGPANCGRVLTADAATIRDKRTGISLGSWVTLLRLGANSPFARAVVFNIGRADSAPTLWS